MWNCFVQLGELMRPENVHIFTPTTNKESNQDFQADGRGKTRAKCDDGQS